MAVWYDDTISVFETLSWSFIIYVSKMSDFSTLLHVYNGASHVTDLNPDDLHEKSEI